MKKWTAMIVALILLVTLSAASAGVPSISTGDTTRQGGKATASTGVEIPDGFVLEPKDAGDVVQNEIKDMFNFVNATSPAQSLVGYFSDEVQQMIMAKLPDTVALNSLQANEITELYIQNYDTAYGDVTKEFTFATQYAIDQAVVVLIGLVDAAGDIVWVAVDAVAIEGGGLAITFPQEVLLQMEQAAEIMMVVFSE